MITTANQVYQFTNLVIERSRVTGQNDIAQRLDDAMNLGSSALEILGAIRIVLTEEARRIEKIADRSEIQEVVHFVNRTFGTE